LADRLSLNEDVARKLREAAALLAQQGANPFRVRAYRRAAESVGRLRRGLDALLRAEGPAGLDALPHVGPGIATAIQEMVRTGRWSLLDRLRGALDPVALFATIPGVGPQLARGIHDTLGVDTLEALEVAAHDGRLDGVPGVGPRRVAGIRAALQSLLGRARRPWIPTASDGWTTTPAGPNVAVLLDVDREYREKAAAGALPTIAPRRFNPEAKAWLPILHTTRASWQFTALYSNTAAAHQLGRTRDWVVMYFYDDHHREGQHTVVTETRGPLRGRRVVRGREAECGELYGGPADEPRRAGSPEKAGRSARPPGWRSRGPRPRDESGAGRRPGPGPGAETLAATRQAPAAATRTA
jgi:putative hydrolase